MVLDMTPIISGASDILNFDFSYTPEKDGEMLSVFWDIEFTEPIMVKGFVKNMAGYMLLSVKASVKYRTACARCAEPVSGELEISFERDVASGDVSRDNDDYIFIEDRKLDIIPPLEEQIMLEMPAKTLCSENCLGLCPKCGKNLNEGKCGCVTKTTDPRLEILKTLLK
ncbi:MAG: YceD family protein [Eubacteriales bacterium]